MNIKLFTVPHSGTRFMRALLSSWNVQHEHLHISVGTYVDKERWDKAIVTLRDPILCRISTINRSKKVDGYVSYPIWLWRQAIRLARLPNVHFVRIDQPRENESELLAGFLEAPAREADWGSPVCSHPDETGLKRRYLRRRRVPDCLKWDGYLLNHIGAARLFLDHGCDYPWITDFERRERERNCRKTAQSI